MPDYKTDDKEKEREFDVWMNSLKETKTNPDQLIKQIARDLADGCKRGFWHSTFTYDNTIGMVYFPHYLKKRGFDVTEHGGVFSYSRWYGILEMLVSKQYLSTESMKEIPIYSDDSREEISITFNKTMETTYRIEDKSFLLCHSFTIKERMANNKELIVQILILIAILLSSFISILLSEGIIQ